MRPLLQELKRRHVYRVTVVYVIASWLLLQVADTLFPAFGIREGGLRNLALTLFFSFPVVLLFTWAFELTPSGIKRTLDAQPGEDTGVRKGDYVVGATLILLIGAMGLRWLSQPADEISNSPQLNPTLKNQSMAAIDVSIPVPGFSGRAAIAVIPFVNMSNDPEQEYFADGITEDLITGLQSFQSFPIIARTSTFQYKGKSPDIREVASTLGAGYIIEGSVRKVDEDVRINVQLINREGKHVWAEKYDFKFEDVLMIQSQLVSKIMLAIEPELIITEADRARFVRTEDMEAFDYFLRGATNTFVSFGFTDLNGQPVTPERLELARGYALKAVELDPNFAAGWRLLNHIDGSYLVNLAYLFTKEEQWAMLERAIEYGQLSRQLSPFEPTVCSCLAAMLLMHGDVEEALLLQEESLRQNPSNATVHAVMAKILHVTGDDERALDEITIARRLSPRDMAMTTYLYFEAEIHEATGRFDHAVAAANRALLLAPRNYDALFIKITSLYASGQRDQAKAAVSRLLLDAPPDFRPTSAWGLEFPSSVAKSVTLQSDRSLLELRYNEGLALVFEDLGWSQQDHAIPGYK
jgi:TolB-like protein/tetratricopeptide (TPR) repeat protein